MARNKSSPYINNFLMKFKRVYGMNVLIKEAVSILERMTDNQRKNAVKILRLLYEAWNDC